MRYCLIIIFFIYYHAAYAQSWNLLPNSPTANFRHDDIYFINPDTGWVVNVNGYIYKTIDGGNSFIQQLHQPATSFRCIGFANSNKGWAGNLGIDSWSVTSDTIPLYQTIDGGTTWQVVTNITGTIPKGLCGIHVLNDTIVYAVGRVGGPAFFLKSIDGGNNWVSVNLSSIARSLIDVHFFSPDTGIIIGSSAATSNTLAKAMVWYTTDGGINWQPVYTGTDLYEIAWKIDFPSRNIGYISVESSPNNDSIPVLKTTDGGLTWSEHVITPNPIYLQGIGFINDSIGWTGWSLNNWKTEDAGITWANFGIFNNFNRFQKINDTVAYACGSRIWKYSSQQVSILEDPNLPGLILEQNFPNPFSISTNIKYSIPKDGFVEIKIYDYAGRPMHTIISEKQKAGTYIISYQIHEYKDQILFYTLSFEGFALSKSMIVK